MSIFGENQQKAFKSVGLSAQYDTTHSAGLQVEVSS